MLKLLKEKLGFNKNYLTCMIHILVVSFFVFLMFSTLCKYYTDSIDKKYTEISKTDDSILVPSAKGNAMGLDYVYSIDTFIADKQMYIYGASTSIIGLIDIPDYNELKACSGSAGIYSYYVMKNYLKDLGIEEDENDLVKIDVSAVTFKKSNLQGEVLVSALQYSDLYTVNDDYSIVRNSFFNIKKFFSLRSRYIYKGYEYLKAYLFDGGYETLYSATVNNYRSYDRRLSFDSNRLEALKNFITSFKCDVVVDILYQSNAFNDSKAGKKYNSYIDTFVIPFLIENNINYIDSRYILDDTYFVDNTHINYDGRILYNNYFVEQMENNYEH